MLQTEANIYDYNMFIVHATYCKMRCINKMCEWVFISKKQVKLVSEFDFKHSFWTGRNNVHHFVYLCDWKDCLKQAFDEKHVKSCL